MKLRMTMVIAGVCAATGCKERTQDRTAATAGSAQATPPPADAAAADAASHAAVAPPAAIGEGPCVGTWKLEFAGWDKPKAKPCGEDMNFARTIYVVRDARGQYTARNPEGVQQLQATATTDTADACTLAVSEPFSQRTLSNDLVYTLRVANGAATATGRFEESDHGGEEEVACARTFKAKATRAPVTAADLAFDPAKAKAELAALWDGDAVGTLKEFCELPVLKTALPRTATVVASIAEDGALDKLVIDGVDQGKLDERCMFPAAIDETQPLALTNRSGVRQTLSVTLELK